jgi:glycosyltransferase involved in cell wall biosynthesis
MTGACLPAHVTCEREHMESSQPAGRTFSMVIATYYNADSLPSLFADLDNFEKKLLSLGLNLELIFVDDGSGDDSFARLVEFRKVRPKTKLVRLARNFGAVAAIKAGMKFVTGDCFMPFGADLQEPLEAVLRMVEQWMAGHKLVLAVRRSRGDPLATRVFAAIYRGIVRLTVKRDYPSGGVGLMLMDRVMLKPMLDSAKNINPNVYAFWLGFDPKIIEYDRLERKHGRSRWTFAKKSQYLIDTITGFSVVPVRIVTCIGLITAMISFLYAFYIVIATISGQIAVSGFATIVTVTSFLGGCTLFMLGVIGEYLWRIFDQVSGRPESVIAEEHL